MRRLHENVVAGGMTQAVVDRLEVVQVYEEDREIGSVAPVDRVLYAFPKQRSVGEARQRVVERLEGELLFEGFSLPQISSVQDHTGRVVITRAAACDRLNRQPGAVGLPDPPLAAGPASRLPQRLTDYVLENVGVLRMADLGEWGAEQRRRRDMEQAFHRWADVVDRSACVNRHDEVGGVADQPPEAGLGLLPGTVRRNRRPGGEQLAHDHDRAHG